MEKENLYVVVRNIWIRYEGSYGTDLDFEVMYATTDLKKLCEKYNLSNEEREEVDIKNNSLKDIVSLERLSQTINIGNSEIFIEVYVDYKNIYKL